MQTHWFYTVWPFIGLGGAVVMVAILLMTDTFRGNTTVSRWRDLVWLAWLAVPLYWLHQLEEYSLPVIGLDYSLPDMVCKNFGFEPYPACPIPLPFYPLVNIALMWFGAPLAAYLCKRNVLIGLSFWGWLWANGLLHTAGGVAQGAYNTGLWSSVILLCRCPSGSFTPARFADRTAVRSWAWRSAPEPSRMSCFSSATGFSRTG